MSHNGTKIIGLEDVFTIPTFIVPRTPAKQGKYGTYKVEFLALQ